MTIDFKQYTEDVKRTECEYNKPLNKRLAHAIFGLIDELGELTGPLKKEAFYGKPADRTNVVEEIGDLMWFLAILLDERGITLEECLRANTRKLRVRYEQGFCDRDAIKRDIRAEYKAMEEGSI